MNKNAAKYYELKNRYQNLIYKISFDIIKNKFRTEHVVSYTLEILSKHLGTFDKVEDYRTAYLAVMLAKTFAQEEFEEFEHIEKEFEGFCEDDELKFFEVDTYSILYALENLDEHYSFILALRYEYGFDDEGMAHLLNTHPAGIRSQLCRATNALNKALDDLAVSGAKMEQNPKDKLCAALPSFINNLGASFLSIECEEQVFSEEYQHTTQYTPPPQRHKTSARVSVGAVIFIIILFVLEALSVFFRPTLSDRIERLFKEKDSSSSKIETIIDTDETSKPFVFTPIKPRKIPQSYVLIDEETTDNSYYARYVRVISNLTQWEITITQKLYDPEYYEQIKQYSPKYLRDFPHKDTIYYEKDELGVVFFHYEGYTFIITFEPRELSDVKSLANSITTDEFRWRYGKNFP